VDDRVQPTPGIDLVLGSSSPRRHALLAELGLRFVGRNADIAEHVDHANSAVDNARRLARAKFEAISVSSVDDPVTAGIALLTADTLVSCGANVLSKPRDRHDAQRMLELVSGRSVEVTTALSFGAIGHVTPTSETQTSTTVALRQLGSNEIARYLDTGAGDDKAGALALQHDALPFVTSVQGCWANVIGLPLCVVSSLVSEVTRSCTEDFCGCAESGRTVT